MISPQGWSKLFEDPVTLPNGRKLVTLLDAGNYIASLPRKEHESDAWQAAIEALLMAAEDRGPLLHARVGMLRALNRHVERVFNSDRKDHALGPEKAKEGPMTVFIYVDTSKQVGDKDHLKVFANQDAAETWFQENDPEGVAFEYEVLE